VPTFGQTTPLSGSSPNSADRCWVSKFTLSENGDVTKLTAFFDYDAGNSSAAGDNVKAVIYADSSGSPGALMAASAGVAIGAGDQTVDFPVSVSLTAGDYWLGVVSDGFNSRVNAADGASGSYARKESLTYASPGDPFGTPDATGTNTFGIYATYTTGPALSSPTPSGTIATATTATIGATTNQASGTFYAVVDTAANLSGVTATQIKAGQKASGSAALASDSNTVTTTSATADITGLAGTTLYSYAAVQNNTNGDSNVVTGTFTTATLLAQSHYRFRNDDGSETTATWAAAEDTNVTIAALTPKRLRVEIGATGNPASAAYKLQYRKVGDSTWRDIN
jgi:hypothetical protein